MISPTALAAALGMSTGATSTVLDRLEAAATPAASLIPATAAGHWSGKLPAPRNWARRSSRR